MPLSSTSREPDSLHNKPILLGNILLFPKVTLLLIKMVSIERLFIPWLSHFHIWKNNILSYVKYSKKAKKWYSVKHNPNYLYTVSTLCWFTISFAFPFYSSAVWLFHCVKSLAVELDWIVKNRDNSLCPICSTFLPPHPFVIATCNDLVAVYSNIHFPFLPNWLYFFD